MQSNITDRQHCRPATSQTGNIASHIYTIIERPPTSHIDIAHRHCTPTSHRDIAHGHHTPASHTDIAHRHRTSSSHTTSPYRTPPTWPHTRTARLCYRHVQRLLSDTHVRIQHGSTDPRHEQYIDNIETTTLTGKKENEMMVTLMNFKRNVTKRHGCHFITLGDGSDELTILSQPELRTYCRLRTTNYCPRRHHPPASFAAAPRPSSPPERRRYTPLTTLETGP